MTARRVLVTGGTGFLGRALVRTLRDSGSEVTVLSRKPDSEGVAVDLTVADQVQKALAKGTFDAVCHLAALTQARESVSDPLRYWTTNVTATINLLAALPDKTPVVLASTAAVYAGDATGALNEDVATKPANPYGASKHAAEEVSRGWSEATDSPVTVLRCFNIAGAVDGYGDPDPSRVIPALIDTARGHREAFTVNGDGGTVRDYTHVLDVADAFALALNQPPASHQTFNVGTGDGLSIAQLLDAIREVTGQEVPVNHKPASEEAPRLVADNQRLVSTLGWVPTRSTAKSLIRDAWEADNPA